MPVLPPKLRTLTAQQLRRAESNGWTVTERAQVKGTTTVNLVGPGGQLRTVRLDNKQEVTNG
jgi:hypothetical protein